MAIGLNQVKKKPAVKPNTSGISEVKSKSATPWQTFDQLGPIARTVKANEAIRSAKEAEARTSVKMENIIHFPKKNTIRAEEFDIASKADAPCCPLGFFGFIKTIFSL